MLDFPLMQQVKLPVGKRSQQQSNKFATGLKNKIIGDTKRLDSLV